MVSHDSAKLILVANHNAGQTGQAGWAGVAAKTEDRDDRGRGRAGGLKLFAQAGRRVSCLVEWVAVGRLAIAQDGVVLGGDPSAPVFGLDGKDRIWAHDDMVNIGPAARRGIHGHIIEISDPAEETFPYSGRTEFRDPETGQKLIAGRAETVAADYRQAWLARREALAQGVRRMGWSFLAHRTDRLASEALAAAHGHLSGIPAAKKAAFS